METEGKVMRTVLTWGLRIIIGSTFMFSGFSKAIDPWGTLYKVDDYLAVMGLTIWPNLILVGVFFLCGIEFLTGVFIILGSFRRSSPVMGVTIMAFMLPLSLWIAIKNPVADCGCFGDALVISNWGTFWKNVVLTAGLIWLMKENRKINWLVTPALQWLLFLTSGMFIVTIELFGYISQPLIDFRKYKVGESLISEESINEDIHLFTFIYEKDGIQKEFDENDDLPSEDEGWHFIERKVKVTKTDDTDNSEDKTFRIWDEEDDDVTNDVMSKEGAMLLVLIPDLKGVSPATTWKLNSLDEWSNKKGIGMIGVVAGSENDIATWKDMSMASYPIYHSDDTQIKEVARGNPAIVYVKEGNIIWKSTLTALNIDDFLALDKSVNAENFGLDNHRILLNCVGIYLIIISALIFLSFTPHLGKTLFFQVKDRNKTTSTNTNTNTNT